MKTMTKLFPLGVLGFLLAGCAPTDDAKVVLDDTGKKVSEGHVTKDSPRSSAEAYERGKGANDKMKNKGYSGAGR